MLSNQPLPHPILMRSIRSIDPITASINFLSFALVACLLSAFIYRLLIAFMKVQHASCRRSSGSWNWLERCFCMSSHPRRRDQPNFSRHSRHAKQLNSNRPTHPTSNIHLATAVNKTTLLPRTQRTIRDLADYQLSHHNKITTPSLENSIRMNVIKSFLTQQTASNVVRVASSTAKANRHLRSIHIERRINNLKIELPPAPLPKANYNIVCMSSDTLYVSGHLPIKVRL